MCLQKKRTLEAPLSFLKFWGNTYNPPKSRVDCGVIVLPPCCVLLADKASNGLFNVKCTCKFGYRNNQP